MNVRVLKKSMVEAATFSALIVAIIALAGADQYLPAPEYESLESYNGILASIKRLPESNEWKLTVDSKGDHRTFYVPPEACFNLSDRIKAGDYIETKLNRRFWLFGSIRAWEINKNLDQVVNYSTDKQRSFSNVIPVSILCYLAIFAACTLQFYSQKINGKS